jgi:RNA polymerase sigma factor (TIGR02999 family)
LVHEAWLRLVKTGDQDWQNRGHFFSAAAEAMRRILIERARRRKVREKGGLVTAAECAESKLAVSPVADEVLSVHEALDRLAAEDSQAAELVKLRCFVGMSMPEAAEVLGMPLRTAERLWTFARAWLRHEISC